MIIVDQTDANKTFEDRQQAHLEPHENGRLINLTEKKPNVQELRKVSTDRFGGHNRIGKNNDIKPNLREFNIPVQQFKEENY